MTTKSRSINASKGLPVNYCSGFRSLSATSALELDGLHLLSRYLCLSCLGWLIICYISV